MSFVDTNLLVYATTPTSQFHAQARGAMVRNRAGERVCISRQILREYLAVVTRPQPWAAPMPLDTAIFAASSYAARFLVLEDGPDVCAELARLGRSFQFGGKQVHDANIVATMLAHGETRLLTFNGSHFRRFGALIDIVQP